MKTKEELRAHHLYKFLYSRCILHKFTKNTLKSDVMNRRKAAEKFINGKIDCISFLKEAANIDMAFVWSDTPEGHRFWSDLNSVESSMFRFLWIEYSKIYKKY